MKVCDLKEGMLIKPAGDCEVFVKGAVGGFPYITVKTNPTYSAAGKLVMYIGDRKAAAVSMKQIAWSNRFVLLNDEIAAVDPSAWARMKEA